MSIIQPYQDYACWAVFDTTSQKLLYSKYNFDSVKYEGDYIVSDLSNDPVERKRQLFFDFLIKNDADLNKPFQILEILKQYFIPITSDIQQYFDNYGYTLWGFNYITLGSFVSFNTILENEFLLTYYDYDSIQAIFEFIFVDDENRIYTKYNFKFTNYSNDFNIFGSKLCIFT